MTESTLAVVENRTKTRSRFWDYLELTKPRLSVMVLVTVAVAGYLSSMFQPGVDAWRIVHAVIGTFMVAASGSALNQYIERWLDARMRRTSGRPLPSRRLRSMEVATFGAVTIGSGLVYLAMMVNLPTAFLGFLTWMIYVWIYTPLKTRTWFNTVIGAVSGAMPILMGWMAAGTPINLFGWSLFGILFLWQFPHFMAIAWLYREQYAQGGMKMLPVVDPTGYWAGLESVVTAAVLIPVSLIPASYFGSGAWPYFAIALFLGMAYLILSARFCRDRDDRTARKLLRGSLLYLPLLLLTMVLATIL